MIRRYKTPLRGLTSCLFSCLVLLFAAGCGSDYSGGDSSGDNSRNLGDDDTSPRDANSAESVLVAHFKRHIQPDMGTCGVCHMPNGIADTDEGRGFILNNGTGDYQNFKQSWRQLGEGISNNPLVTENADPGEPHIGGKLWPRKAAVYSHVVTLLQCWDDPESCTLSGSLPGDDIPPEKPFPLLGSSYGNHVWNQFCAENDGDALLPPDPRTLVVAGANTDRAVHFNAYYEDCHVNLPEAEKAPKTCREYLTRVAQGDYFTNHRAGMADLSVPANTLNNLWQRWGYNERPANFDQLLTERYGFNPAPYRNPYPLPGEDPVNTDGGSGQLPMGLIQGRDEQGNYNGKISMNCYICHGGQIGEAADGQGLGPIPGMGNTNTDMMILMRDISGGLVGGLLPISLNNTRGTSNAVGAFDMLTLIWDVDTLSLAPNPLKLPFNHSYHGNQDMPNWWNVSHRPRKFFDGGVSVDSTRIDMAAADQINLFRSGESRRLVTEAYDQDLQAYVDAQVAPPFPGDIDEELAQTGAVVFHTRDLWASEGNADVPRPEGNGSCASCHGAYSPRYVNDDRYLEDPALEGVAAYLVPLDIIETDPARALSISETVREAFSSTWWGYPDGAEGYKPPDEKGPIEEFIDDFADPNINPDGRPVEGACGWTSDFGYLAPPLYGVWASSPYFHNGSVPTLRQVLKPEERPAIWSRYDSTVEGRVKGYDMSLDAYDLTDQVGWKYQEYCARKDRDLEICEDKNTISESLLFSWLDNFKDDFWLLGFISKPYMTQKQIDERKIYNTRDFSNSNQGHEFTNALSDQEVRALIEYLKTL